MSRLSGIEVGAALDKELVPTLGGEAWRVCKVGYRVEGRDEDRYLVPAYDIGLKCKWEDINLSEKHDFVPDFVKAYRGGLERFKTHPVDLTEFEQPILEFVGRYGVGLTGERRWTGGREETIESYVTVMQEIAPIVRLIEALLSGEELAIQSALRDCSKTELWNGAPLWDAAANEVGVGVGEDGEEYEIGLREHALLGLGYVVAYWFHKLCFPFAIPEPHARRLGQMNVGWGFSNLTGAIFWHLYQLLGAQSRLKRCESCGDLIPNAQVNTRFCRNNGHCRSTWNYQHGEGKSSKGARKRARKRAREAR